MEEEKIWIHHVSKIVSKKQVIPDEEVDNKLNLMYQECLEKNWVILGWIQVVVNWSPNVFACDESQNGCRWQMIQSQILRLFVIS